MDWTQQDAINEWYKVQGAQPEPKPEPKKEYTRQEQLFDAVLWEAEYGADERKPFYFALAAKLVGLVKK